VNRPLPHYNCYSDSLLSIRPVNAPMNDHAAVGRRSCGAAKDRKTLDDPLFRPWRELRSEPEYCASASEAPRLQGTPPNERNTVPGSARPHPRAHPSASTRRPGFRRPAMSTVSYSSLGRLPDAPGRESGAYWHDYIDERQPRAGRGDYYHVPRVPSLIRLPSDAGVLKRPGSSRKRGPNAGWPH